MHGDFFKRAAIDVINIPALGGALSRSVMKFLEPCGSTCCEIVILRASEHSFGRVADARRGLKNVFRRDFVRYKTVQQLLCTNLCRIATTDALQ
jgi:hypothetical protein